MSDTSLDSLASGIRSGTRYTVLIDDTGSPGAKNTPGNLHPARKSWVAVILSPQESFEVSTQLPLALDELERATGATEFHFTEIYSGKGPFKNLPLDLRLGLFGFMAEIFSIYKFPILVQTLDPDNAMFQQFRSTFEKNPPPVAFKVNKHEDVALFFLLCRVKWFLREKGVTAADAAYVVVDEGFRDAGASLRLPSFSSVFHNGNVSFAASNQLSHLQLADFAAFSLNREQWLLGKDTLSPLDETLATILSKIAWNYVNIGRVTYDQWWNPKGSPN